MVSDGPRFKLAEELGLPIVNLLWLEETSIKSEIQPFDDEHFLDFSTLHRYAELDPQVLKQLYLTQPAKPKAKRATKPSIDTDEVIHEDAPGGSTTAGWGGASGDSNEPVLKKQRQDREESPDLF